MGFRNQLVKILDYLPQGSARQTLLFSATQTRDVKHLAMLSINHKTVEYVGINDGDSITTPDRLKQTYVLVPIEHKLNCLYSFLKSHLRCKTIVFFATCSQVRHAWDLFCRLRPGLSVLAIHGKLSQTKRLLVYDKFTTTPYSVMFATDVASRGLDFPSVDWVVQLDAPEDYDMYVHRVGRTARFQHNGSALLLLDPSEEEAFIQRNKKAQEKKFNANLKKKSINTTKTMLVSKRASSLVAEHSTLYVLAKKAFWSYVRSLSLMPNDGIWSSLNVRDLNLEKYSKSLGLPKIPGNLDKVLQSVSSREGLRESKNVNRKLQKLKELIRVEKEEKKTKRKLQSREKEPVADDDEAEGNGLIVVKAIHGAPYQNDQDDILLSSATKRKSKKIRIDGGNSSMNSHIVFEDDGSERPTIFEARNGNNNDKEKDRIATNVAETLRYDNDDYIDQIRKRLEKTKELDKKEERDRLRTKHKKKRISEKKNHSEEYRDEIYCTVDSATDDNQDKSTLNSSLSNSISSNSDSCDFNKGSNSDDDSITDDDASIEQVNVAAQEKLALSLIHA